MLTSGFELKAIVTVVAFQPAGFGAQIKVHKLGQPALLTGHTKRVNVLLTNAPPVFKPDAELKSGGGGAHKRLLVDLQQFMKRT